MTIRTYRISRFLSLGLAIALSLPALASAQGSGRILTTDGSGNLTALSPETGWRTTWHLAASGNFDGAGNADVLIYDRLAGEGRFMDVSAAGAFTSISLQTGWSTNWDQIVPGNYGGSSQTDLFFYSASTGIGRFYTTGAGAAISLLGTRTGMQEWDMVIPGQFGGSSHTDLFFYSRTRGEGAFMTTDGAGNMTTLASLSGMNKNWDQIAPGNFNGDAFTDLFFYQRVRAEAKFFATNGAGGLQALSTFTGIRNSWDIIVPGAFGGSSHTDLWFYDRTAGEGRFAFTTGTGGWSLQAVHATTRPFSHVVPGAFGSTQNGLFAYDSTVRVRIHAVKCSDDDGGRATLIDPTEVRAWVDRANIAYAQAGVHFEFDPSTDFEVLRDTVINSLDKCSVVNNPTLCDARKAAASAWATRHPCKIVVFFRHGHNTAASGSGFSGEEANYVAMPGFTVTDTWQYFQDPNTPGHATRVQGIKLLSHELGHYLGLEHTFVAPNYGGFSTPHAAVVDYLAARPNPSMSTLDGDGAEVFDTPPDVGTDYYLLNGWNPADLTQEIRIQSSALNLDFTFSTDRHNVMSYFGICDDYLRVSRDQVREIRRVLHTVKSQLLDTCAHRVLGVLRIYGTSCAGTGGVLPSHAVQGTPDIGQTVQFAVSQARPSTSGVMMIGSRPARLNLGAIGMGGCDLLVTDSINLPLATASNGNGTVPVTLLRDTGLIGASIYSQAALVDLGTATPLKVVTTNGVSMFIGGLR